MAQASQVRVSEAAERYAQAAFELARDAGALNDLERDMAAVTALFAESADLRAAAASPVIDADLKTRALLALADKVGLSALGRNVVGVVARNGRAADLPGVAKAVKEALAKHRNLVPVEVVSAQPLSGDQLDGILKSVVKALGSQVDATTRVDEGLIGGFLVRAGSRQFDASLKTKLESLRLALKTA